MPLADPVARRAYNLQYKAARRAKLAAQERERQARLKVANPEAWRATSRAASARFRAAHKDDASYREVHRKSAREHWQKIKDDPSVKQKNLERVKRWYLANADRAKANSKRARQINVKSDLQYRLAVALRRRMYMAIRNKRHGSSAVRDLGCSLEELAAYLEGQFQPGMSWDNWSMQGWHIDHIRPLRSFDLTDPEQYAAACHYTNLQPLWAAENISKGARPGAPHPEAWRQRVYPQAAALVTAIKEAA